MSTVEKIRKAALARLDAGEPIDIILQDYADFEDELRPVLEQATGKPIRQTPSKVKVKAKNRSQQGRPMTAMMLASAAAIIVIALGAVMSFRTSEVVIPPVVQNETACLGIPEASITSAYALNNRNEQQQSSDDIVIGGVEYETTESLEVFGDDMEFSATAVTSGAFSEIPADSPEEAAPPMVDEYDVDLAEPSAPVTLADTTTSSRSDDAESDSVAGYGGGAGLVIAEPVDANISRDPMRAGEIDDNAEWDDYQEYRNDYLTQHGTNYVRDVDTTDRQVIRVVDSNGQPVLGACIEIYNGESRVSSSRTYATGMTLFFPNLLETTRYVDTFTVVVSKGTSAVETTLDRENNIGGVTEIELDLTQQIGAVQLDVVFLLDATGSMADEIAQLQGNILTISEQIDSLPNDVDVRYGLVSYRDRGDQYVTRVSDFTDNVSDFQDVLLQVQANGGGDYPESMNEGLDMALNAVQWRGENTIKLVFLVADAPPHIDYQDDADYSLLMQDALARGIKIHQIASSGLQPEGEFVMRQIGQYTMGRFLFLTYEDGNSGEAGDTRTDLEVGDPEDEQGIGDYSVNQLDELVLRLITDEIAALRGE